MATCITIHRSLKSITCTIVGSRTFQHLHPLEPITWIDRYLYKPFKSMTGQWFENRFARGIDLNPSLAIDDRCHASQHASASVGRSPPREHCVSRLPELISSFYCRQTNAVSISRKRDPILLGPRGGRGGGGGEKNQTA